VQVTFLKRKNGLLKKAMELGILCDCEVSVVIFNLNNGKLFEYSSVEAEKIFSRYATYNGPSERRKKSTVHKALSPPFETFSCPPPEDENTDISALLLSNTTCAPLGTFHLCWIVFRSFGGKRRVEHSEERARSLSGSIGSSYSRPTAASASQQIPHATALLVTYNDDKTVGALQLRLSGKGRI
jgi:hypothetical protein